MKKYKIGYTQGVYDMFHIGHLNILNHAKELCEKLIVGINTDNLVNSYKHKVPIINENERLIIVNNIKAVDEAILVDTLDKNVLQDELKFNAIFIGDDWKNNQRWLDTKEEMKKRNVDVVFLPHTDGITSSDLREVKDKRVGE